MPNSSSILFRDCPYYYIVDIFNASGSSAFGFILTLENQTGNRTLDANGAFVAPDELLDTSDEPSHDELCELEQQFLLQAIEEDWDLSAHVQDAVNSLKIVLAADEAFRTGQTVVLA